MQYSCAGQRQSQGAGQGQGGGELGGGWLAGAAGVAGGALQGLPGASSSSERDGLLGLLGMSASGLGHGRCPLLSVLCCLCHECVYVCHVVLLSCWSTLSFSIKGARHDYVAHHCHSIPLTVCC